MPAGRSPSSGRETIRLYPGGPLLRQVEAQKAALGVEILPLTDGLVVAWLPGTEGDGVADVLFGDYQPTGKLDFINNSVTGKFCSATS